MSVVKVKHNRNFTTIPNEILNNPKLSFRAKGVVCYLLSKPEDWHISVKQLTSSSKEGRDAIYTAFDELIEQGYMIREQDIQKGRFMGVNYIVSDQPFTDNPQDLGGKPGSGNPVPENPPILNTDLVKTEEQRPGTAPPKRPVEEKTIQQRKIDFLKLVIDWVAENPNKYPKALYVEFAKYWVEQSTGKRIKLRFEEQKFFDIGRRLSTWFQKVKDDQLSKYWDQEEKSDTLNNLFKTQILKINATATTTTANR